MIRLHQTFGAHTGRVIDLDRDVIRFGRLPDNEVSFDPHADLDASGRHAELRREGGHWVLVDVGSRNGTLVRGQKVTRHILLDGDEIEFGVGGPRVRVELSPPVSASTAQATPVSGPGFETGPATPIGAAIAPPSPAVPPAIGLPAMPQVQHPTPPPSPFGSSPGSAPGVPAPGTPAPGASYPGGPVPHPTPMMAQPSPSMGGTPVAQKRYGQRTVGMMIQAALQQAEQSRQQGGRKSTAFIRAVAQEAAQSNNRGLKIGLWIIGFLLVLTLAAVVGLFFWGRYQEQELRDENVRLQRELTELGEGETSERARLEERIQELNDQLGEQEEETGASIAENNEGAVWALVRTRDNGDRSVLCTAFAVRNDVLATSAHCTGAIRARHGARRHRARDAEPRLGLAAPDPADVPPPELRLAPPREPRRRARADRGHRLEPRAPRHHDRAAGAAGGRRRVRARLPLGPRRRRRPRGRG